MKKYELKIALLSIPFLSAMAGAAVVPAMEELRLTYSNIPDTYIKLILTLPSLTVIPVTFLMSTISKKYGKRNLLIAGLLLYIISGVGGAFTNSIWSLLSLRALIGISIGILMPLTTSIISENYNDQEKSKMMGYLSSFAHIGGIFTVIISGLLATLGWRTSFSIYILAFLPLVLWFFKIPRNNLMFEDSTLKSSIFRLPSNIYGWCLAVLILNIVIFVLPTNLAIFLAEENLGGSEITGICMALFTVAAAIAGILYSQISRRLGRFTIIISVIISILGFYLIKEAGSLVSVIVSMILLGGILGLLYPEFIVKLTNDVKGHDVIAATSLFTASIFLGQFASPIIFDSLSHAFSQNNIRGIFQLSFICIIILTGIYIPILFFQFTRRKSS